MNGFNVLSTLTLKHGAHSSREEGMCAMEAVAWLANEPHSDSPACTCPVLASVVRKWNDSLPDADRTRLLRPLLPKLIGTRAQSDDVLLRRMYIAVDWQIRTYAPAFLRLGGFKDHANALEALSPIVDDASLKAATNAAEAARSALAETVAELQESAVKMIERMCEVTA